MVRRWRVSSPDRRGLVAGGAVFLAGFGVMNLFWRLGTWPKGVPGLWDYRSATLGDGLLLPIAAGILVGGGARLHPAPNEKPWVKGAALLGFLGGSAVIALWLLDPNPQINWTQPAPGTLNAPGIYHATFLITASAFFWGAIVWALRRVRALRSIDPLRARQVLNSPEMGLLVACGLGFVGLVVLDSYPSRETVASLSSIGAVLVGTLFVVSALMWAGGRGGTFPWRSLGYGAVLAIGVCLAAWGPGGSNARALIPAFIATCAVGVPIALHFLTLNDHHWWLRALALCVFFLGGLNVAMRFDLRYIILAFPLAAIVLIPIGGLLGAYHRPIGSTRTEILLTFALFFPSVLLITAHWLQYSDRTSQDLDIVFNLLSISGGLLALVVLGKDRYEPLMKLEETDPPGRQLETEYFAIWATLLGYFIAVFASFFATVNAGGYIQGLHVPFDVPGTGTSPHQWAVLVGDVLGACLALAAVVRSGSPARPAAWSVNDSYPEVLPDVETVLWISAAALVWGATPWLVTIRSRIGQAGPYLFDHWFQRATLGITIYVAVILGVGLFDSFWSALGLLNLMRVHALGIAPMLLCGFATASTVSWLLVVGFWSDGRLAGIVSIADSAALVLFSGMIILPLCCWALARSMPDTGGEPSYISLHHPAANVFQDSLLYAMLTITGAVIWFGIARFFAPSHRHDLLAAISIALVVLSVLGPFFGVFIISFGNYDAHIEREEKRMPAGLLAATSNSVPTAAVLNAERAEQIRQRMKRHRAFAYVLAPHFSVPILIVRGYRKLVPRV